MPSPINIKKIAFLGCALAVSLILSYVESLIPITFGLPGIKLGLANLSILLLLYLVDFKEAFLVDVMRVLLISFLFGSMSSFIYSFVGAMVSYGGMLLLKKCHYKMMTVSICGGLLHNVGQLCVACVVLASKAVFIYLPWLLVAGGITGGIIGIVGQTLYPYLNRITRSDYL